VIIDGLRVSIRKEPSPRDNTIERCLEWFPILTPAARVLECRTWAQRTFDPDWQLPDDLEGPGLVYLRESDRIIGRPTLFVGRSPGAPASLCDLQRAAMAPSISERHAAIDAALTHLADASPAAAADREYLLSLIGGLDALPAAAFNMLERLNAHTVAQAAILTAAVDDAALVSVWKLQRELPLMWAMIPRSHWDLAFETQTTQLTSILVVAGLARDQASSLSKDAIRSRARSLVNLEPLLTLPLIHWTELWSEGMTGSSLFLAAQDRLRRSGDLATGAGSTAAIEPEKASCFRSADSPVRDSLPATWPFMAQHWEGLDAACAAAICAAGRAELGDAHVQRIRAAQAQEPLSFADLYAAALRLLMQAKPLICEVR
jgi:hypothetical protein